MKFKLSWAAGIFIAAVTTAFAPQVFAAGIQIFPEKVEISIEPGHTSHFTLTVANPTRQVELVEIYPDELQENFSIQPQSFTLEAGQRKEISISATDKNLKDGQKAATHLSVVAKPLGENEISVAAGTKLPLSLEIKSKPANKVLETTSLAAASIVALGFLGWLIKRQRGV